MLMHLLIAFILLVTGAVSCRLRHAENEVLEHYRMTLRLGSAWD